MNNRLALFSVVACMLAGACTAVTTPTPTTAHPPPTATSTTTSVAVADTTTTQPVTTTTTSAPTEPPPVTLPALDPADFCDDNGKPRRVVGTVSDYDSPKDLIVFDMVDQEFAVRPLGFESQGFISAIALPDGSTMVSAGSRDTTGQIRHLHVDGSDHATLTSDDRVIWISGFWCDAVGFRLHLSFIDQEDAGLRAYAGIWDSPSDLVMDWAFDEMGHTQTDFSPNGEQFILRHHTMDPAFGERWSVRSAATGEVLDAAATTDFGPTIDENGDPVTIVWWLRWLPDSRVAYVLATPGATKQNEYAANLITGGVTLIGQVDERYPPRLCVHEVGSVAGTQRGFLFSDGDGEEHVFSLHARGVRFTC